MLKLSGLAACLLLLTGSIFGATFATGDVFASVNNGNVNVYTNSGTFITTLNTGQGGFTTGSGSNVATNGDFYVTNFSANSVTQFDNTGAIVNATFGAGAPYVNPESILFDKANDVFVGNAGTNNIIKLDSAGNLLATYHGLTEDRGNDLIDLSSDQHTIYYTSEGDHVLRFDTATNTQLSNLNATALTGSNAYALRILSDGSVLVADTQNVVRLDASGNIIQTYTPSTASGFFSLNLDPNGTSFWTGSFNNDTLYKVNIATGLVETTISTTGLSGNLFGVSVYGEITQGTSTPEPSQLGISIALIGLLALFGYWRKSKAVENA